MQNTALLYIPQTPALPVVLLHGFLACPTEVTSRHFTEVTLPCPPP